MSKTKIPKPVFSPQHQPNQPGLQGLMNTQPASEDPHYTGNNKLQGKVALICSGDSGIGQAVAIAFAKEGAIRQFSISTNMKMPLLRKPGSKVSAAVVSL